MDIFRDNSNQNKIFSGKCRDCFARPAPPHCPVLCVACQESCTALSWCWIFKVFNSWALTPLRRDVIATTGDHWLVLGLYLSALLSSVVSSLPPTA